MRRRHFPIAVPDPPSRLVVGDLEMDLKARCVWRGERPVALLPREFRLLEYLMRHAGQPVTRAMLLEHVWHRSIDTETNVIAVHMSGLRDKVDKPFRTRLIRTVRMVGYMLRTD